MKAVEGAGGRTGGRGKGGRPRTFARTHGMDRPTLSGRVLPQVPASQGVSGSDCVNRLNAARNPRGGGWASQSKRGTGSLPVSEGNRTSDPIELTRLVYCECFIAARRCARAVHLARRAKHEEVALPLGSVIVTMGRLSWLCGVRRKGSGCRGGN